MTKLSVVVGGQYGSEAKGHITAQLVQKFLAKGQIVGANTEYPYREDAEVLNIRVAGPNAGHSAVVGDEKVAFRQIPVGALYGADWAIAAGSEIEWTVLQTEMETLQGVAERHGIHLGQGYIDPEVTILIDADKVAEAAGDLMHRLGSTGKGIGAARAGRLMRQPGRRLIDHPELVSRCQDWGLYDAPVADFAQASNGVTAYDHVIVEGTQGFGLGLHAGHYPQCTSSDCRAIDFLAMAGISPWHPTFYEFDAANSKGGPDLDVWVVLRMFPIRVAGNSGPMKHETTWDSLGLPEERTTVTQKIRRVGGWDQELALAAIEANGGEPVVKIALTMVDQAWPALAGINNNTVATLGDPVYLALEELTDWAEDALDGHQISAFTTSAKDIVWRDQ